jgi:hypothetical protein
MDMAEICAQFRQVSLDVDACPIPLEQRLHGESMPKVMDSWAVVLRLAPETYLPREDDEGSLYAPYGQSTAALRDKETSGSWKKSMPKIDVVPECFHGGNMERNHS